ncbi:hypothetical protein M0805_008887 [Coniferiporia weirii]|nr:hypothetical protein M0805_008887 [Coniferiporia weirii]
MSVSLDDIWSELLVNSPKPSPRPSVSAENVEDDDDEVYRPSKRLRSTLFLDDPDEEGQETHDYSNRGSEGAAKNARPDIDSLFDDLEEPTDARSASRASKPFDLATARREAQLRAEKEAPASSFPRYAVQSSSPPREGFGEEGKTGAFGARKGDDATKEKRPIAKLDETRILSRDGLPALVQLCKDFKPRGKGHELADLNRLFSTYQFWAHKMYPKLQFSDTVNRVEKLCHSRRVHMALSVWKDEVKGVVHGGKTDGQEDIDMQSDKGDESGAEGEQDHDVFGPRIANTSSSRTSPSSRASSEALEPFASRPPSSGSEADVNMDDEDDPFDIDALLAAEEGMSRAAAAKSASQAASAVKTKNGSAARDYNFDDDESEMWAALHGDEDVPPAPAAPHAVTTGAPVDTYVASSTSAPQEPSNDTDDDDVWDVLDDIEKEQQDKPIDSTVQRKTGIDSTPTPPENLTKDITVAPASGQTASAEAANLGLNDDDWDDMYV